MRTAPLPAPILPQMSNDGVINAVELASGGVDIEINKYSDATAGDYICLYWDNEVIHTLWLTSENISTAFPLQVIVPAALTPDGAHQTWFTSTDRFQNTAASGIATALIQRDYTGDLTPPDFPDAVRNTIDYDSVLQNDGTHVHIPPNPVAMAVGDTVFIYWAGFSSDGTLVPDSVTSVSHIVAAGEPLNGFSERVSSPYVSVIGEGSATAWYAVQSADMTTQNSDSASVKIDMSVQAMYPAPVLPQATDGWIDYDEAQAGVTVNVASNTAFMANSVVTVYWQGYDNNAKPLPAAYNVQAHVLTQADVKAGFSVTVPTASIDTIGTGYALAWYQVASPSVPGISATAWTNVDTEHALSLPAPEFPAAEGDNTIDDNDVRQDNGTAMTISWPSMQQGDAITAYWTGYHVTPDQPVPGATWTESRNVTANEAESLLVTCHIPAEFITPVGTGLAQGQYTVQFADGGGHADSALATVNVQLPSEGALSLNCTTGAPAWTDPSSAIKPLCTVTVSGPAGATVEVELSGGGVFNDTGSSTWSGNLDQSGGALLDVFCMTPGLVTVKAYSTASPATAVTGQIAFTSYAAGKGALTGYAVVTGAASNGATHNSVYIRADTSAGVSYARVAITAGSARLVGGLVPSVIDIPLYEDGTAMVDLTDLVPETVSLTLSLPESSTSVVYTSTVFVTFP